MYRELVERRRWFSEEEFLSSLAISQAMPGINVINLSMWVAFRMRGSLGAVVGFCAMVFPPLAVIIPLSVVYEALGRFALVHHALAGIAAAALALTLNMGQRVSAAASRDLISILIVAVTFVGVGVLRFPMLETVLAITPFSLAWSFYRERRA
jgi:chromate transporter